MNKFSLDVDADGELNVSPLEVMNICIADLLHVSRW